MGGGEATSEAADYFEVVGFKGELPSFPGHNHGATRRGIPMGYARS